MKGMIYASIFVIIGLFTTVVYADDDYIKYQRYQDFERTATPQKIKQGEAVYKQYCVRCHGVDGTRSPRRDVPPISYMPPYKIFDELVDYKTEDDLFDWEEQAMIDVTQKLSYPELEAVALYIGTMRK